MTTIKTQRDGCRAPARCLRTDEVRVCLREENHPGCCVSPEMSAEICPTCSEMRQATTKPAMYCSCKIHAPACSHCGQAMTWQGGVWACGH